MQLERSEIQNLVNERIQARAVKDFARSDVLRKKINDLGIAVSDTAKGCFWEVAK